MDRNSAIGLFLMAALLLIYLQFAPKPKPEPVTPPAKTATTSAATPGAVPAAPDSTVLVQQLGSFASAAQGTAQTTQLANDNLTITFSSKGGRVEAVRLNKYKTFRGQPLDLIDAQSAQLDSRFRTNDGRTIKLSDLYFQPTAVQAVAEGDKKGQRLTFTAPVAGGQIEQTYTLLDNSFEVGYNLRMVNLSNSIAQEPITFTFLDRVRQTEKEAKQNRNHTTINHYLVSGDYAMAEASDKPEEVKVAEPLKWAAHKHDFFVAGIIAQNQFNTGEFSSSVNLEDTTYIKTLSTTLTIPAADVLGGKAQFRFYFGPNAYNILKEVTPGFDRNVYLGWGLFRWVNQFVILPVFHALENFTSNYGIIIALLVVLIKLVTWPLTYKSYESQARMKVLKPELDAIKEKYPDDSVKQQQEQMKLYQTMGVSPLGGCVPTLLTIPILFAMFQFFPNAIELRQEHFLWANDLSTYDDLIKLPFSLPFLGNHISLFTLLMTISTLAMTYQSNQMNPAAMQGPMKFYSYLMPLVFFFVLNDFAAALTWYYLVSNLATLGQQAITRSFMNDKKVRAKLEANKVKNKDKKPSGIQARLAEAMKAAQDREAQARQGGRASAAADDTDDSDVEPGTGASDISPKRPRKTRRS